MKIFISFLFVVSILSCNANNQTDQNAYATVEKMNGFYVFVKSKPQTRYEFLGAESVTIYDKLLRLDELSAQSTINNIKSLISFSDNLQTTLNELRRKYPTADGVIFDNDMSKCQIIKFKKLY